jgi:hypothetical protein
MESVENRQYFEIPVEMSDEEIENWAVEVWMVFLAKK